MVTPLLARLAGCRDKAVINIYIQSCKNINTLIWDSHCTKYRIAGNFQGRKLSRIGEKYNFHRENFRGLLAFAVPKDAMPPNFVEKTFVNSHKTVKFVKFSPSKVFCYTVS